MVRAQHLLADGQGSPLEGLRFVVAAQGLIQQGQFVEAGGRVGVFQPQLLHTPQPGKQPSKPGCFGPTKG